MITLDRHFKILALNTYEKISRNMRGWVNAFSCLRFCGFAKIMLPSLVLLINLPLSFKSTTSSPKVEMTRRLSSSSVSIISWEILSASITVQLCLISSALTVDLPHAMPPVRPYTVILEPISELKISKIGRRFVKVVAGDRILKANQTTIMLRALIKTGMTPLFVLVRRCWAVEPKVQIIIPELVRKTDTNSLTDYMIISFIFI